VSDAPLGPREPSQRSRAEARCGVAVSVIMPVYNGADVLPRSLPPLVAMLRAGEIAEIIVVDDGSTDASAAIARGFGVQLLRSGGRVGPGGARNVAAPSAIGDVLWFVDADVVVHDDAARVLADALRHTDAAAVFGSYDDRPPGRNFLSQYKNLVHRYYHRRGAGDAETFWAGCGAVRKEVFLAAAGFDAARYPYPSIEDIELGWRLRQRGLRIALAPDLQGTHLKVWRLGNLLRTDIFRRALPWSRLIHGRSGLADALNIGVSERINAVFALGLLLTLVAVAAGFVPVWLPLALLAAIAAANREFLAFFYRARGPLFAIRAVLFHQLYYIYSAVTFAWCWLERRWWQLRGQADDRARRPGTADDR
jgi:glycosyltransferase involved in cell wall biosynthesis